MENGRTQTFPLRFDFAVCWTCVSCGGGVICIEQIHLCEKDKMVSGFILYRLAAIFIDAYENLMNHFFGLAGF